MSEGVGNAVINVTLSNPSDAPTEVSYTLASGTAGTMDYTTGGGVVSFSAGQTVAAVTVTINDDNIVENSESFSVSLTSITAGNSSIAISTSVGNVTIVDNDSAAVSIQASATTSEGTSMSPTPVTLVISQSSLSSTDTTVTYSTANGTAMAGSDFTGVTTGTAVILAGSLTVDVVLNVTADSLVEADESFSVTLTNASGHPSITVGSANTSAISITDDDSASLTLVSRRLR